MPDSTIRYHASSRYAYASALRALVIYARSHPGEDFDVYPAALAAMERNGLAITGPDLSGVTAALAAVPGLHQDGADS